MVAVNKLALLGLSATVCTVNCLSIVSGLQKFYPQLFGHQQEVSPKIEFGDIDINLFPGKGPDERPIPGDSPIVQCDVTEPQILNLQSVILEPNPPVKGANLTIIAKGYLSKTVEDGAYVEVDVRYGFIKLIHQTFDICEEITKVDMECPIEEGQQLIMKEVEIPSEVPPGKYTVNARAYTKDDEFITCLSGYVEFPAS